MKVLKKNTTYLLFALFFGIALSLAPKNTNAQDFLNEIALPVPADKIPCWSASQTMVGSFYVDCSTCTKIKDEKFTDGEGKCTR